MERILDLFSSAAVAFLLSESGAGKRKQEGGVEIMKMEGERSNSICSIVGVKPVRGRTPKAGYSLLFCFLVWGAHCFKQKYWWDPRGLVVYTSARELYHILVCSLMTNQTFSWQPQKPLDILNCQITFHHRVVSAHSDSFFTSFPRIFGICLDIFFWCSLPCGSSFIWQYTAIRCFYCHKELSLQRHLMPSSSCSCCWACVDVYMASIRFRGADPTIRIRCTFVVLQFWQSYVSEHRLSWHPWEWDSWMSKSLHAAVFPHIQRAVTPNSCSAVHFTRFCLSSVV